MLHLGDIFAATANGLGVLDIDISAYKSYSNRPLFWLRRMS